MEGKMINEEEHDREVIAIKYVLGSSARRYKEKMGDLQDDQRSGMRYKDYRQDTWVV